MSEAGLGATVNVAERRAQRDEQGEHMARLMVGRMTRMMKRLWENMPRLVGAIPSDTALVSGTPASPGRATGSVRLARGPRPAGLRSTSARRRRDHSQPDHLHWLHAGQSRGADVALYAFTLLSVQASAGWSPRACMRSRVRRPGSRLRGHPPLIVISGQSLRKVRCRASPHRSPWPCP